MFGEAQKAECDAMGNLLDGETPWYPHPSRCGSGSSHFHRPRSGGMGGVEEAEVEGRRRKEKESEENGCEK